MAKIKVKPKSKKVSKSELKQFFDKSENKIEVRNAKGQFVKKQEAEKILAQIKRSKSAASLYNKSQGYKIYEIDKKGRKQIDLKPKPVPLDPDEFNKSQAELKQRTAKSLTKLRNDKGQFISSSKQEEAQRLIDQKGILKAKELLEKQGIKIYVTSTQSITMANTVDYDKFNTSRNTVFSYKLPDGRIKSTNSENRFKADIMQLNSIAFQVLNNLPESIGSSGYLEYSPSVSVSSNSKGEATSVFIDYQAGRVTSHSKSGEHSTKILADAYNTIAEELNMF